MSAAAPDAAAPNAAALSALEPEQREYVRWVHGLAVTQLLPLAEVSAVDVSPAEVSAVEVSPAEVSPAEVSAVEVSPAEVSPAEVSAADVSRAEVSPAEVSPAGEAAHGHVNRPLLAAMGKHGLLRGLFGGSPDQPPTDAAAMRLCLLRETIAGVSVEAETALALQGLGSYPILQSGGPETVERWIPGVVRGTTVAAFALTEPEAGSDAAALNLRAERDGDGWRLYGDKLWISNAPEADVYTVFARTTPGAGARGVTAFAVPGDADGLSGEHLELLSPHPIGRLRFDAVRVGPADVLGEVDAGFRVAMRTLDLFRPSVGAFAVGMAQSAIDATLDHVSTRQAYGGPLSDQQSVRHTLADLATQLQAARLLVYAAARCYDAGGTRGEISRSAAMAKLFATEAAQRIVDQCVQLHGARALQRGHLLERLYRDVRAPRIYEGASEVQRSIIARELLRERAAQ